MLTPEQRRQFDAAFLGADAGIEVAIETLLRQIPPDATYGQVAALLRKQLPEGIRELAVTHTALAQSLYRASRANAGAPGEFEPTESVPVELADVEESIRATVNPLAEAEPTGAFRMDQLLGALHARIVKNARDAGRRTIRANAARDPAGARYARIAHPGACAFCMMLTTRGYVYDSKSVLQTEHGEDYHTRCHCTTDVIFPREALPAEAIALADEWQAVTKGSRNSADARRMWKEHVTAT